MIFSHCPLVFSNDLCAAGFTATCFLYIFIPPFGRLFQHIVTSFLLQFQRSQWPAYLRDTRCLIQSYSKWLSGFKQLPPRSPDATPCDFFLRGYVKDQVYVPPLPQVSRNWRYESKLPMKPSQLTCYKHGTNSIIVLMFVESQRV